MQHFLLYCSPGTIMRSNLASYNFDGVECTETAANVTFHECHKLTLKPKVHDRNITFTYLLKLISFRI